MPSLVPTTMMLSCDLQPLRVGRVDDELAIDDADAHRADGAVEGNVARARARSSQPLMPRTSGSFSLSAE